MTLTAAEIAGMRTDLVATQLDMVCTVQRKTEASRDEYNQPVVTWANHLTAVAAHYWEEAENEMTGGVNASVSRERLVLAANSDVTPRDRISSVTGVDGTQVSGQLEILEVLSRVLDTLLIVKAVE